MSEGEIRRAVGATLEAIEREEAVRVLFAVESGSRAWGFASADSDYDIRFVYVRRSVRDYVRLYPERDVIERPLTGDLDVNGWDLFKALRLLLASSNPPLLEWLQSPIVYRERDEVRSRLWTLAREAASPRRMAYHYRSMARRTWETYLDGQEESDKLPRKKYLYALRPLCCLRWIESHGDPAPTALDAVLAGIVLPDRVRDHLAELREQKRLAGEIGMGPADPVLGEFIAAELARTEPLLPHLPDPHRDPAPLEQFAWDVLRA